MPVNVSLAMCSYCGGGSESETSEGNKLALLQASIVWRQRMHMLVMRSVDYRTGFVSTIMLNPFRNGALLS